MGMRERILVLDADDRLLIELEALFEGEGFDTTTTWEYRQALELLNSRDFDFVLVGDHPPEIDASELLKQLHAIHSTALCVVLHPAPTAETTFRVPGVLAVVDRYRHDEILRIVKERFAVRRRLAAA